MVQLHKSFPEPCEINRICREFIEQCTLFIKSGYKCIYFGDGHFAIDGSFLKIYQGSPEIICSGWIVEQFPNGPFPLADTSADYLQITGYLQQIFIVFLECGEHLIRLNRFFTCQVTTVFYFPCVARSSKNFDNPVADKAIRTDFCLCVLVNMRPRILVYAHDNLNLRISIKAYFFYCPYFNSGEPNIITLLKSPHIFKNNLDMNSMRKCFFLGINREDGRNENRKP